MEKIRKMTLVHTINFAVYLSMSAVRSMMQWCPSRPVSNIQATHMWYQS